MVSPSITSTTRTRVAWGFVARSRPNHAPPSRGTSPSGAGVDVTFAAVFDEGAVGEPFAEAALVGTGVITCGEAPVVRSMTERPPRATRISPAIVIRTRVESERPRRSGQLGS